MADEKGQNENQYSSITNPNTITGPGGYNGNGAEEFDLSTTESKNTDKTIEGESTSTNSARNNA